MNKNFAIKILKDNHKCLLSSKNSNFKSLDRCISLGIDNVLHIRQFNQDSVYILLYGNLLQHDLDFIFEGYISGKLDNLFKDIDGSYVLFIIDTYNNLFLAYSDRIASKKIFIQESRLEFIISNDIKNFDSSHLTVDEDAIIFYLTNGFILQDTIFKGIKILPYASKFCISNGIDNGTSRYWDFVFNTSYNKSEIDFIDELHHLLQMSIKKRIAINEKLNLSLSGGYDSCAVLAALLNSDLNPDITLFNYAHVQSKSHSDKEVAQKICSRFNLNLISLPPYIDGVIDPLVRNGQLFQGVANNCEEISSVMEFSKDNHSTSFIFGEEAFGTNEEKLTNIQQALKANHIYPGQNFGISQKYLKKRLELRFEKSNEYYSNLFVDVPDYESLFDMKHYFYFRYRICGVLTMWRDFFYGPYYHTINPLLDYEILDLVLTMPSQFRKNRVTFKKMLYMNYPEMFSIPRARYPNNITSKDYYRQIRYEFNTGKYNFHKSSILNRFIDLEKLQDDVKKGHCKMGLYLNEGQDSLRKILRKAHINRDSFLYSHILKEVNIDINSFLKRVILLHELFNEMPKHSK